MTYVLGLPHGRPNPASLFFLSLFSFLSLSHTVFSRTEFFFYLPADEREDVQKKTFTKWVNSQLTKVRVFLLFIIDFFSSALLARSLIVFVDLAAVPLLPQSNTNAERKEECFCVEGAAVRVKYVISYQTSFLCPSWRGRRHISRKARRMCKTPIVVRLRSKRGTLLCLKVLPSSTIPHSPPTVQSRYSEPVQQQE